MKEIINKVNYNLLMHRNFNTIKKNLNITDDELFRCINKVNSKNTQTFPVITTDEGKKILYNKREFKIHELRNLKKKLKLLITSDKHIDHTEDRMEFIDILYEEAEKRRVDYIFDLGDVLNGPENRVHNPDKCRTGTLEGCLERLKKYHPSNMKTYFITGNHDLKFMDNDNCNIGKIISNECDNMVFLGNLFSVININGIKINISHGSYEEKILAHINLKKEFPFLTYNDPLIIFQGHFHVSSKPIYKDRLLCQVPTLKSSFDKNKKYENISKNTGAIFLTITELLDRYEMEYEEVKFVEKIKIIKKEISIKKE